MEGSGQSLPQDNMSPKYSWQKPWQRVSISVSLSLFNTGCFNHTDFSPLCTPYNTAPQTKTYFHMIYLLKSAASDRELVGEQRTTFYFQIIKFPNVSSNSQGWPRQTSHSCPSYPKNTASPIPYKSQPRSNIQAEG